LLITKGQVIRFQAAYVNRQQIYRLIGQLQDSQRQGRRWLAEESPIALAATGTDSLPGEKPRSRLKMLFGTQLRLLR
jgi:hypothetical protein